MHKLFRSLLVKYQVLVPVAAIIGRFDVKFVRRVQEQKKKDTELPYRLYAPLIPFLIKLYRLSSQVDAIMKLDPIKLIKNLLTKVFQEREQDPVRLEGIENTEIEEIILNFTEAIRDESIQQYLSLEAWLRGAIDHKAQEAFQNNQRDIHTLTEPLTKVFGGVTRYEFTVRGAWYDTENKLIDDILIVVEFCARSSIMARKFIEKTVVRYLRTIAKEDCVLVQEIPIRGFLQ